jgi:hypothetical protein
MLAFRRLWNSDPTSIHTSQRKEHRQSKGPRLGFDPFKASPEVVNPASPFRGLGKHEVEQQKIYVGEKSRQPGPPTSRPDFGLDHVVPGKARM